MKRSSISHLHGTVIVVGSMLILASCGQSSTKVETTLSSRWLDSFYNAYSLFDGSHLDFYANRARLIDETAGLTVANKEQLRAIYEQSKAMYSELDWDIQASMIDGNRAVVRGRANGVALSQEFDVAFTTWFEVVDGKIVHQVDYVDYEALRKQLKPANE